MDTSAIAELLFVLASDDRLKLLSEISTNKKQRASELAPKISATIQETSRHVNRLHDAGLVERDSEGYYSLTSFGKAILKFLPPVDFVSAHRGYFLAHDLSTIPEGFQERVGELSQNQFADMAGSILRHSEEVLRGAKEYVLLLADHPYLSGNSFVQALTDRNISVRIVIPKIPEIIDRDQYEEATKALGNRFEVRFVPGIKVALAMNEQIAGVAFSDLGGKVDYNSGFRSTNERFRSWCEDLFSFYWGKSKSWAQMQ